MNFDNPVAGGMKNGEPTLVAIERATFVGVVCANGYSLRFQPPVFFVSASLNAR